MSHWFRYVLIIPPNCAQLCALCECKCTWGGSFLAVTPTAIWRLFCLKRPLLDVGVAVASHPTSVLRRHAILNHSAGSESVTMFALPRGSRARWVVRNRRRRSTKRRGFEYRPLVPCCTQPPQAARRLKGRGACAVVGVCL